LKKFLQILALGLILFANSAEAGKSKQTKFQTGKVYEGTIVWKGGVRINLPSGRWTMLGRWGWAVSAVHASGVTLALLDGNFLKGLVDLGHVDSGGKWISHVNDWLQSVYIVNKTDGCYERSEYYLVKHYKSGAAFNCLVIRHFDLKKEIYSPDEDAYKGSTPGWFKVWIRKNEIELPKVMLGSEHVFYAPSVRNKVLMLNYFINPELYGASKTEFGTEETSEYHRANIDRYPDKKKFMKKWVKLSAKRHKSFEEDVGAQKRHKLNLRDLGVGGTTSTKATNSGIGSELKELHKLYLEGALTKEEFEKAKKKLLN